MWLKCFDSTDIVDTAHPRFTHQIVPPIALISDKIDTHIYMKELSSWHLTVKLDNADANCTALHCTAMHCNALHCTALHFTLLHCTTLHCTALHCNELNYNTPNFISLHFTALHCTQLNCTLIFN